MMAAPRLRRGDGGSVGLIVVDGNDGGISVVAGVVVFKSSQYLRFNLLMSFLLMRRRCPIVSPSKSLMGIIVSLPLTLKAPFE